MNVTGFVPIKLNSRRLPNKNFLRLGDKPLVNHILNTLLNVEEIQDVFCYSSQPTIMDLVPKGVKFLARPTRLDGDEVQANELFRYVVERLDADVLVLCHATGPFIKEESIAKGVQAVVSGEYDCAFAVQKHKTYSWYDGKPLNYDPLNMAQTQGLVPVYTETSGFYIFKREDYLRTNTRINGTPYLVEIDQREAVDIDEVEDFHTALQFLHPHPDRISFEKDFFFVDLAKADDSEHSRIRHICFDFDGVLIDSVPVMKMAWKQVCDVFKLDIPFADYQAHIGRPFFKILELLGVPETLFTEVKAEYDRVSLENQEKVVVYEGVIENLLKFKAEKVHLTIATSKDRVRTLKLLSALFPENTFDFVATPETVGENRGKPEPDQLLAACLHLGVSPGESLYIGDMEVDRLAANRAGFGFVHAEWGYGDLSVDSEVWFKDIKDLYDFIKE